MSAITLFTAPVAWTPSSADIDQAEAALAADAFAEIRFRWDPDLERLVLVRAGRQARPFSAAHLRIVFLLAESQGSTHTRLRHAWDAKAARAGDDAWPWISDSGIRTRTSELVSWGLVEATGAFGETPAGRRSQIWALTGVHPDAVGRPHEKPSGLEDRLRISLHRLLDEAGGDVTVRAQLELAAEVAGVRS